MKYKIVGKSFHSIIYIIIFKKIMGSFFFLNSKKCAINIKLKIAKQNLNLKALNLDLKKYSDLYNFFFLNIQFEYK